MTPEQIRRLFPNASASTLQANDHHSRPARVPDAKPKEQARALDGDDAGEAPGAGCPHVCFTLRRVRLLDIDARYTSIKDLLDGLQIARLIRGDREGQITLEVRQERVKTFAEEATVIEITYAE